MLRRGILMILVLGMLFSTSCAFASQSIIINGTISYRVSSPISNYNWTNGGNTTNGTVGLTNNITGVLSQLVNYELDPSVSLFPIENSTSAEREINFSVENFLTIPSCSLYLNGVFNQTNSSEINLTGNNSFILSGLSVGNYNASVSCEDIWRNGDSSSNVSFSVLEIPKDNGGGSYSGGGVVNYKASNSSMENGYSVNLRGNDSITFYSNSEKHNLTLNSFNNESASVTVRSTPQTLDIKLGEAEMLDLNDDGIYDIEINYTNYLRTTAKIKIKEISVKYKEEESEKEKEDGTSEEVGEKEVPEFPMTNLIFNIIKIIIFIGAIIIIFFIISSFIKKTKKDEEKKRIRKKLDEYSKKKN